MRQSNRDPPTGRQRQVTPDVPLPRVTPGVVSAAVQLDRDLLCLVCEVDPIAAAGDADPQLTRAVPQSGNIEDVQVASDFQLAFATGREQLA